jgi:3',5'-cyclic AMP phosphodiesterase CpdA
MTRGTVTNPRAWPVPVDGTTIHVLGDVHVGGGAIPADKLAKAQSDILGGKLFPTVAAHVQTGDGTNQALTAEDTTFQAWWAALPTPKYLTCGNHDIWANSRTPAQWASAYGVSGANHTADLGTVKLIFLAPDAMSGGDNVTIVLNSALTFLDTELGNTSKPCFIFCHAPLKNTVLGDPATTYPSSAASWFVTDAAKSDSSAVTTILAAHSNAKAWIAGHTHSPIDTPGLVASVTVGSHTLAAVNASCLFYVGQNSGAQSQYLTDPMHGIFITYYPDRIEVRFRNPGAGVWVRGGGATQKVATVTL